MIRPIKNRILVELEQQPTMQGGIHIPNKLDKGKIKPVAARVKEIAAEVPLIDYDKPIKINNELKGKRVLVPCYGGFHVDDTHRIYEESEIFGILTEKAEINV